MPSHIGWGEIGERLLFTVIAGTLVGINRGEHGRPAGLRTTLLVCLAAAVSMIQVNLLLPIRGKAADSYVVMDLMRLPLGILSGMGFIGAGAILRKDNVVLGVTTAATLWFVTVLGLCFGGGQIELGCAALGLGLIVLWALKPVEKLWKHQRQGTLTVVVGNAGPTEQEITESLINGGYHVYSSSTVYDTAPASREMQYVVRWRNHGGEAHTPAFVAELAKNPHTLKVAWQRLRQ